MPGNFKVVSPTVMASDATTKNQPPDIDIMVFQTRPGAANGTSARRGEPAFPAVSLAAVLANPIYPRRKAPWLASRSAIVGGPSSKLGVHARREH
jgi:hypothetical protein